MKNGVKAQWIVLSHVLLNASQISCESMGVKGINSLIKLFDWKNIINMTYSFKCHNYWRLAESWDNSKWTWLLDSWTNDLQKTNSLHLKKKTFRKFLLVTIERQYANEIDSILLSLSYSLSCKIGQKKGGRKKHGPLSLIAH